MKKLGTMRLRDMKLTKSEKAEHMPMVASDSKYDGPEYPYGLRVHLDDDALKKLEIATPEHGQRFRVVASGCVKSVSVNENERGINRHVEIQLEQLLLVPVDKPAEEEITIRSA